MILFIPILHGILNGIGWIVGFFRFIGPWLTNFLQITVPGVLTYLFRLGPLFSRLWQMGGMVLRFCFSWKGFLSYLGVWFVGNLFGFGKQFADFHGWLASSIGKALYEFFFDGERGICWDICMGLLWIGEVVVGGFEGLGLREQSFGAYGDSISWAMALIGRMNSFFPIVEAGVLLSLFLTFVFFFLMVKGIAKLIPTIG